MLTESQELPAKPAPPRLRAVAMRTLHGTISRAGGRVGSDGPSYRRGTEAPLSAAGSCAEPRAAAVGARRRRDGPRRAARHDLAGA